MPPDANCSVWPARRATRLTSACCSGSTNVTPTPPRPARPVLPTAVDVAGMLGRRIEVDHVRDVDEVEPARRDVRRDERRGLARLEPLQCTLTLSLAEIAVEGDRVDLMERELLDEAIGATACPHEYKGEPALLAEGAPRVLPPCPRL